MVDKSEVVDTVVGNNPLALQNITILLINSQSATARNGAIIKNYVVKITTMSAKRK